MEAKQERAFASALEHPRDTLYAKVARKKYDSTPLRLCASSVKISSRKDAKK
jgi:hypothetical protein